jgi:hypothetical protein
VYVTLLSCTVLRCSAVQYGLSSCPQLLTGEPGRAPWQVQQGDTERLPPNFKKHLHNVLEKLVTEQTLVKEGKYLYHLPPAVEGGHTRGDEPMSPHAEVS